MELSEFLALPFPIVIRRDDDGQMIATIPELPGCKADGATETEAIQNLKEIQALWLEAALSAGKAIPRPMPVDDLPSGKWLQRAPRTLHARLVAAAKEEDTSLNQFVCALLAEGLALRTAWRNPPVKLVKAAITQRHPWKRYEGEHPGEYAYAPVQTDPTAAESLKCSEPIPMSEYRRKRK